jgi:hypothetical protein
VTLSVTPPRRAADDTRAPRRNSILARLRRRPPTPHIVEYARWGVRVEYRDAEERIYSQACDETEGESWWGCLEASRWETSTNLRV